MSKMVSFFCAAATVAFLSGCDPYCTYDFYLKNDTDADLIVEVEPLLKSTIILPGDEVQVYTLGSHTDDAIDRFSSGNVMISFLEIKINEVVMPESIWQRKYWEYTSESKSHAHYTLTVTEELLESLKQPLTNTKNL